jgi:hypothetical protein
MFFLVKLRVDIDRWVGKGRVYGGGRFWDLERPESYCMITWVGPRPSPFKCRMEEGFWFEGGEITLCWRVQATSDHFVEKNTTCISI